MMITISDIEKAYELPVAEWPGKCFELACTAAKLIEGAVPIYGHYYGPIAPGSFFAPPAGAGIRLRFVQHGWVLLPDGRVLDPTRWVFEGVEPHLFVGEADEYDEGGNKHRMAMNPTPPAFSRERMVVVIMPDVIGSDLWVWIEAMLGLTGFEHDREADELCSEQLCWLANLDPRTMRGHAKAFYALLRQLDSIGFVPIDNQTMVEQGKA